MIQHYGFWYGSQIEIGWLVYRVTGWLWDHCGGKYHASYWLDFLPAWGQQRYYHALNRARAKKGD